MTVKRSLALFTALAGLALGGVAIAGPGMGGPMMGALQELDLTEDQQDTLQQLREEARESHQEVREQMKANREAIQEQLRSDAPDAALLHDLVDEASALRTEMAHARIDRMLEVHATLDAEQREELFELLDEGRQRHHRRRVRRHRSGPGGPDGERGPRMRDDLTDDFGKL